MNNAEYLSPEEVAIEEGFDSVEELMHDLMFSSIVPACCSFGCQVEPDGRCEHGFESVLLALYLI